MAVPRNRMSNARKNSKRAHQAKTPKQMTTCQNCGVMKLPHVVCQSCGTYKGLAILPTANADKGA